MKCSPVKLGSGIGVAAIIAIVSLAAHAHHNSGSNNFVHGHALVMPDGHMAVFGSYGKLDHCIRPGDTPAEWLQFLNGSWRASRASCNAMRMSAPSTAPQALVAEISARMELTC